MSEQHEEKIVYAEDVVFNLIHHRLETDVFFKDKMRLSVNHGNQPPEGKYDRICSAIYIWYEGYKDGLKDNA